MAVWYLKGCVSCRNFKIFNLKKKMNYELDFHIKEEKEESGMCENEIFVNLLKKEKILFEKVCTPLAIENRKLALESLKNAYNFQTKQQLSTKQVFKKFNNMKSRMKARIITNQARNKDVILKNWEQLFVDLWNSQDTTLMLDVDKNQTPDPLAEEMNSQFLYTTSEDNSTSNIYTSSTFQECDEFKYQTMEDLQRLALISQIKAAQAQEKAANAQLKTAVAQEELALKQAELLGREKRKEFGDS